MVYWIGLYLMAILNYLTFTKGCQSDRINIRNLTTKIVAEVGSNVWLNCSAVASQDDVISEIKWFKFSKPLFNVTFRSMDSVFKLGRHVLVLDQVLLADAGRYVCTKVIGRTTENRTFTLSVKEPRELPVIVDNLNRNISITLGQTAVFSCKIQSRTITYIEWHFLNSIPVNDTNISVSDDSSPILPTKIVPTKLRLRAVVPLLVDSLNAGHRATLDERRQIHEDLLYIYNVTHKDSGTYVCMVFNKYGKTSKEASLTVLSEQSCTKAANYRKDDSKIPIAILIAIPAGLFILACTVILRALEKTRQEKKLLREKKEKETKEKEEDVPAPKLSISDVNENRPVAMVTAQNYKPVIHERIRALSVDEQRFDSLSTSSASEAEVVLTENKLANRLLSLSKQSSLPSSTEAPYTSATPDLLSSSSCGLELDWEGLDLSIPQGYQLVQLSREAEV